MKNVYNNVLRFETLKKLLAAILLKNYWDSNS